MAHSFLSWYFRVSLCQGLGYASEQGLAKVWSAGSLPYTKLYLWHCQVHNEVCFTRVLESIGDEQIAYGEVSFLPFFPPFSLLFSLSLLVQYILVHFIYGRRYICSFSFQTQLAKISLKDICVFERQRGYGSLSNAGDVIQYFNPRHFMNSSHISWSHCRYFLPPNPQHLKSCENLSCRKAQE